MISGLLRGTLDVPAGIQSAIEHRCAEMDLPALGLWAQVPHYVTGDGTQYPAASLALIEELSRTTGLMLPTGELAVEAERTRHRIDAAVASNTDHEEMVRALEVRYDDENSSREHPSNPTPTDALPSADELAAEVEEFLRDQGSSEG